jgi:hypothetical protein
MGYSSLLPEREGPCLERFSGCLKKKFSI